MQGMTFIFGVFVGMSYTEYSNKKHKLGVLLASIALIAGAIMSFFYMSWSSLIISYVAIYILRLNGFDPDSDANYNDHMRDIDKNNRRTKLFSSCEQKNDIDIKPITLDEKINAVDQLFYRAQNYETSEEYIKSLEFIKKLKNLAPFNAWLLYQQNSDVTYVASADEWATKFNRVVKPKARAYIIMKAFGPVDFVFDIADTVGEELPKDIQAPYRADGVLPENILDSILKCCMKKNISVSYDLTLGIRSAGWASHDRLNQSQKITINASHSPEIQFSTLIHELAHLMLGHCGKFMHCECDDRSDVLCQSSKEIEAETVSWIICSRLGIKTDADRYLSNHIKNKEALRKISLQKVLTTSDRIESMIISKTCNKEKLHKDKK